METRIHSPADTAGGLPAEDLALLPETPEQKAEWVATLKRLLMLAGRLDPDGNLKDEPDGS